MLSCSSVLWRTTHTLHRMCVIITQKIRQFGRQFVGNSKQFGNMFGNSGFWMGPECYYSGNSVPGYFAFYKTKEG